MTIVKNSTEDIDIGQINRLASHFKLDQNVIRLLIGRGYKTEEAIANFLSPSISNFYDPYLLNNMDKVVARIRRAIESRESIVILGDYDTDGISATAIMYKYFESVGLSVNTFLPNRIADGYGLSFDTIDKVKSLYNPSLIITVDCGISANKEIEYASSLGIEVIVTDHHDIPDTIPNCLIINAKLPNQKYQFRELCGAGVALKLVQALTDVETSLKYVTIAALATVADIVPLVDENRLITYVGIKNQANDMPIGLVKLIKKLRIEMPLSSTDISFKLAPKINATGRMGDPSIAFNLYVKTDPKEIASNIEALLALNDKRVTETNVIVDDATSMLENVNTSKKGIIIVKNEEWESGVLGIICSKLVDTYNKPACVLSMIDGELKGSLRSTNNINIYDALTSVKDLLVQYGGHDQAAGITLKKENYDQFCDRINEYILSTYSQEDFLVERKYDLDLAKVTLTDKFMKDLSRLEPFGLANEKPLFKLTFNNVSVSPMPKFPNHINAKVNGLELIGFNMGQYINNLNTNSNKTVILEISNDKFAGKTKLKGIIKYINFSKLNTTVKTDIAYGMYLNGLKDICVETNCSEGLKVVEEAKFYNYIYNTLNRSKFGTLIIANTIESYNKFLSQCNCELNYELYNIHNKTGVNTILFAPNLDINYINYDNIILLDTPIHIGYINRLLSSGKNVIMSNTKFDMRILKNIDVSRAVFAKYHNAIKSYLKKPIDCDDLLKCYMQVKRANPHFTNIKFNQFVFVVLVFNELGILNIDRGNLTFTDVKSSLNNSKIYNFISLLIK